LSALGKIDRAASSRRGLAVVRMLLLLGWVLAAVGYYGPWIGHPTAALTLSGVDMGEFVKFLPGVLDGSLAVTRQIFYLPPLAVVISIALLANSRGLRYVWPLRILLLVLAVPVSLQLLPPAWSPANLMTTEFRPQAMALGACWLLLAGSWWWGQAPLWLAGLLAAGLTLAAGTLSGWQFWIAKPAIDAVYHTPPAAGWGLFLCLAGLALVVAAGISLLIRGRQPPGSEGSWPSG
jgi:hypothetical protein